MALSDRSRVFATSSRSHAPVEGAPRDAYSRHGRARPPHSGASIIARRSLRAIEEFLTKASGSRSAVENGRSRCSLTSLSENRQLPRRSAPGIIAAEVHAMNEVATAFLTLGAVSYGGAGVLGMMQAEIQQKRGWLSKERFLEGLALSNLLPGPTA